MRIFNEYRLAEEIGNKWGAHGAHMEVYQMLLNDRERLAALNKELVEALEAFAEAGYTDIDPRIKYVEMQVTREEIAQARAVLVRAKEKA